MRATFRLLLVVLAVAGCHRRPAPPAPRPTAPPRAPESCGNCVDDDGNGRTDFEDAACCPHPVALEGITLDLQRATPPGHDDAFTLTARIPTGAFTEPNPFLDDVTVQLRAGAREVVCAQIGHQYWRKNGETYRFRPHDGPTRDLPQTFVRVVPNGGVAVHAAGLRAGLAPHGDEEWHVTVRIGDGCAAGVVRPSVR